MDVTRRNLIQILGIAPAAAAAQTQAEHTHAEPAARVKKAYQRKVFDDHQWRTVHVLCDLIIPADEHAAAPPAGVPEFIDDWLDFRKQEDGNDDLRARSTRRPRVAGPGIDEPIPEGLCGRVGGAAEPDPRSHRVAGAAPRRTGAGPASSRGFGI